MVMGTGCRGIEMYAPRAVTAPNIDAKTIPLRGLFEFMTPIRSYRPENEPDDTRLAPF
jgi:hypothetical protein